MLRVAFVNIEGNIDHIITPSTDTAHTEGEVRGEWTIRLLPFSVDPTSYLKTKYWDGEFKDRDPSPGGYYAWKDNSWVLLEEELDALVSRKVKKLLRNSDWTQLDDTSPAKVPWAAYRAELRAFTRGNADHISQVIWPTEP